MACTNIKLNPDLAKYSYLPKVGNNLFCLRKALYPEQNQFDVVFWLQISPNTILQIYEETNLIATKMSNSSGVVYISDNEPFPLVSLNNSNIYIKTTSPNVVAAGTNVTNCQRRALIVYPSILVIDQYNNTSRKLRIIEGKFYIL